jgi:hypothetical protein
MIELNPGCEITPQVTISDSEILHASVGLTEARFVDSSQLGEVHMPLFRRTACTIAPALWLLLPACSSAPGGVPTIGSAVRVAASPARAAQKIPLDVLYVSDYNNLNVLVFSANPRAKNAKPLLTIGIGAHPYGLWVDRQGILYVATGASVQEFRPGATAPFQTITQGINRAEGVTVDSNGTLYVVGNAGTDVAVVEYPAGSTSPSQTLMMTVPDSQFGFPGGATFDSAGNLYVDAAFYPENNGHVFRFAPGQTTGMDLGLEYVGGQDGLAVDAGGNLYVGYFGQIEVYHAGATKPFKTVGTASDFPSFFARSPKGIIYQPMASGPSDSALLEFGINSKNPIDSISGFFAAPIGAAVRSAAL